MKTKIFYVPVAILLLLACVIGPYDAMAQGYVWGHADSHGVT